MIMKPYGYKNNKKILGDGCFLCTQERKTTKSGNRQKAKKEIKRELQNTIGQRKARTS